MRILCVALLRTLPLIALAQEKDDDDGWNGIRAGYHSSNVDGDWGEADARTGFYAGYYRNLIKVPLYRLSTGLEYHTAGASSSVCGGVGAGGVGLGAAAIAAACGEQGEQ
ncbi:MAG TPA: hypothetical protein PLB89_16875 [Flavobacteriales bacterium]|nr:hypothetical protein [Flavobacteriales bacterium]